MKEKIESELPEGNVIAESVAIEEVKAFVNLFKFKPIEDDKLETEFSEVIYALQLGNLTFDGAVPTLKLIEPLKNVEGGVFKDVIVFKTRILSSEQEKISRGMDLKNQMMLYLQKSQAHLIGVPVALLDKFNRFDLKVIEQLCNLFM